MLYLLQYVLLLALPRVVQLKMNVLLMVTDDLRPELSIYGRDAYTPNFER